MANNPKDPPNKGKSPDQKVSVGDFDKTVLDIDLRKFDEDLVSKSKASSPDSPKNVPVKDSGKSQKGPDIREMKAALDETLIFERPPLDEEDTDLHRLRKQKELEEKQKQEEIAQQIKVEAVPASKTQKSSNPPLAEQSSSPAKEKAKQVWKEFTSFTMLEAPPQGRVAKIMEFVGGLVLLLALLDICIEGLAVASPLAPVSVGAVILCVLVNVYFIIRKGNFHAGLELSAWAFLALLAYATWKYGAFDPGAFSLLKRSPSQIYNFVFFFILILVSLLIYQNKKASWLSKGLLALVILYGSAGFIQNLLAGIFYKRIWNVEDTLYGTELWKWLPFYYFRPVAFCFWILFPLLTLYFLFQKTKAVFAKQKSYARESTLALGLVFLSFCLGHLILFKNHYPSVFGFVLSSEIGWGQTRAWSYGAASGEDYDIEVSTAAGGGVEKNNDALSLYKMGAMFVPLGEAKKIINLSLRAQGGVALPFFRSNDLWVLQEQVQQKPIKLKAREESFLNKKTLVLLVDRSSSMSSYLSYVDKAGRSLFEMMNSRERLFWTPFAENAQAFLISDSKGMKKSASALFAQSTSAGGTSAVGARNVSGALEKALGLLKGQSGEKVILLISSPEPITEDLAARYLTSLKNEKIKFYGVNFGEASSESLRSFAEGSGGKWVSVKSPQNIPFALRSLVSDAFGQYQISYEGQFFSPKFDILTPHNGEDIYKDTPLQARIQNFQDVRLSSARLYMDGKLLQEIPIQSQDIVFSLNPAQLSKGSHTFKLALVGEGSKEFTQEIKLNISSESDFAFIRPLEGDVVSGPVNLEVYYKNRNQNPIQKLEFLVDGQKVGEATSEPYLLTLDAQSLTGSHMLQALAIFADGSTKSDQVKVNGVSGFSIRISSPSVGEFLNNLTEVEADVTHNLSEIISKVEFWVDGAFLSEVTQAPYKYLWDNSELGSGRHVLQARAFASNNWVSTDAVIINIGNGSLSVQLPESASPYLAPDYVEWVVDASSSMNGEVGGVKKLDLVKQSLIDMFPKMPAATQFALRSFGAAGLSSHHDCKDSILNYPLKNLDSQKMENALASIEAQGMSPLAYTLDKLRGDFKSAYGTRVVVLFTDGFDNCGGDPVGQLERWKKEKLNIKLYILGLDIEGSRAETELKRLASIAGGQYYPVKNEKEIIAALEEMIKVTYRVFDYKDREVIQKPIGSPSVSLRTGEYRLEIDLEPPLVKEKVLINNGVEKKILIRKDGNSYSFSE